MTRKQAIALSAQVAESINSGALTVTKVEAPEVKKEQARKAKAVKEVKAKVVKAKPEKKAKAPASKPVEVKAPPVKGNARLLINYLREYASRNDVPGKNWHKLPKFSDAQIVEVIGVDCPSEQRARRAMRKHLKTV
jgi:hypothetical protein